MRQKRFTALGWPILFCVCLVLASTAAMGASLQNGTRYNNVNFAKVIVTYSWSGHFAGEPDV